jgi:hypothetical protein
MPFVERGKFYANSRGNKMKTTVLTLITSLACVSGLYAGVLSADKSRGEWTLMVIPDTQGYAEDWTEEGYHYWKMERTFEWILSISDALNIRVVQSVGDMIESHNETEWSRAKKNYYFLLNNGIPIVPAAGNHEWEEDQNFAYMNQYFPLSDFQDKAWWGGHFGGIQNSYQLFTIGQEKYLLLTLQYHAGSKKVGRQDAVDWAKAVFDAHPDRKLILSSHWNNDQPHFSQLVDPYPNMIMTLAGHRCVEEYYVSQGRTHNFVQDYQCEGISKGEQGLMQVRYYLFKPMDDRVEWYSYSAIANDGKDAFWTRDPNSEGSFELVQADPVQVLEKAKHPSSPGDRVLRRVTIRTDQGVAVDEKYFYAISNTVILKCDKQTRKIVSTWQANKEDKAYEHFLHLNSGTVVEGKLYCAHSRYSVDPNDCTVEIWNVENQSLTHEGSIRMPRKHGSLTWIDRHADLSWWMCYAVYGKHKNRQTKLVKYQYRDGTFIELESWFFPEEVVVNWEDMSCSGGSWGADGYLYTTGHDHARAYVLEIDENDTLRYVRTEKNLGFFGQGIAWDRFSTKPVLWGIDKSKGISLTSMPGKKTGR